MTTDYLDLINQIGIIPTIISVVGGLFLSTFFMLIALAMTKGSDRGFGKVIVTTLLSYLCSYIPFGCFLSVYIIGQRHDQSYGKAFLTYIIAILLPIVIMVAIIVFFVLGLSALTM